METSANSGGPLEGLRVIEFGQLISTPGATSLLGDLGAEVIKIERLSGELARLVPGFGEPILRAFNRNKHSLSVDLQDQRVLEAIHGLIESADVVVHNMKPGAMQRLGLDAESLLRNQPSLIYASIAAFPFDSPSGERGGVDIVAQAESGMMSINGDPSGPPMRIGMTAVDAASTFVLAHAIMAAYIRRLRTGEGAVINVSLFEVAMYLQTHEWSSYLTSGVVPVRMGNSAAGAAPSDVVATRTGYVALSGYADGQWQKLCAAIGKPELAEQSRFATNTARVANRAAMLEELANAFSSRSTAECVDLLEGAGLLAAEVKGYDEVRKSPDVVAAGIIEELNLSGDSSYQSVRAPFRISDWTPGRVGYPDLGDRSREVLLEAGCTEELVQELFDDGVVR
jgi:crotonobetainyl-CoA:carnitine CoA-transferase CaiB-like acyl-CoA transferase